MRPCGDDLETVRRPCGGILPLPNDFHAGHGARLMNVSRPTAVYKWCGRSKADPSGAGGWTGSAGRAGACRIPVARWSERSWAGLRRRKKAGAGPCRRPARPGPSMVHAVPARHQMSRLAWMDRPTGKVIPRYEHDQSAPGGGRMGAATPLAQPKPSGPGSGRCYPSIGRGLHLSPCYSED